MYLLCIWETSGPLTGYRAKGFSSVPLTLLILIYINHGHCLSHPLQIIFLMSLLFLMQSCIGAAEPKARREAPEILSSKSETHTQITGYISVPDTCNLPLKNWLGLSTVYREYANPILLFLLLSFFLLSPFPNGVKRHSSSLPSYAHLCL